jgi:methionine--tRNA ligase beta chain
MALMEENSVDAVVADPPYLYEFMQKGWDKAVDHREWHCAWAKEALRILKPGGVFLFTTHDRDRAADYRSFWKAERKRWGEGRQKPGLIEFGAFTDVEIRVGEIVSAERVEGADKLLKLSANVGEQTDRTIVAGIAKSFTPEELVGKRVAMVTNLKPAKLFGIKSEAMILAAETDDKTLALAEYGANVKPGTRIK